VGPPDDPRGRALLVSGALGMGHVVTAQACAGSLAARGWSVQTVDAMRLLVMMIFCSIILVGIVGEDMLEKPFYAVPYYFFWGVIVAYVSHVRVVAARGPATCEGQAPPEAQFEQIGRGREILS